MHSSQCIHAIYHNIAPTLMQSVIHTLHMHTFKIHKIFLMHVHSTLPCIDSGILMHSTIPWPNHDYLIYDASISLTCIGMTPFYIPIFTWYAVSYLDQSMEFVISKLLPAWVLLTPFPWPIWLVLAGDCSICSPTFVIDLLPCPFLHRVAGHFYQHHQHIHLGPCHRWFFHYTITIISGLL